MLTTLVLGAGISQDFGYPSGPKLVEIIKTRFEQRSTSPYKELLDLLQITNTDSIDAFIAMHPETADYIRLEIAQIIYGCEKAKELFTANSFYKFFFNKIQPEHFDKFRIVTFNYDRSLEQYAYQNTAAKMKWDRKAALKAIERLQITHIHGRLSSLEHELDTDPLRNYPYSSPHQLHEPYDKVHFERKEILYGEYAELPSDEMPMIVHQQFQRDRHGIAKYALKSFKFISENGNHNKEATSILEQSDRIIFLGFSYNEDNLRVLGFNEEKPYNPKEVCGTGLGLSPMRKAKAERFGIKITNCSAVDLFENYIHLDRAFW